MYIATGKKARLNSSLSFPTRKWYGNIEYKMPKALSKQIIASYKGEKKNIQQILYMRPKCRKIVIYVLAIPYITKIG